MIISTKRLRIRPFNATDINQTYLSWLNDKEVMRFSNQRFTAHCHKTSMTYLESFSGTSNSFFLLEDAIRRNPIGTATVYRTLQHGTADIGLLLGDRSYWGKGYGKEAWMSILNFLSCEMSVRKVTGGALRANHAMIRIMRQSGMVHDGTRIGHEIIDGCPVDLLYFAHFCNGVKPGHA
jgi:ribosomal-protein-alanine N-acetyltransferase